jgi:hypothetical protein
MQRSAAQVVYLVDLAVSKDQRMTHAKIQRTHVNTTL